MKKKVLVIIAIILILTIFTILIIRDIKNKTKSHNKIQGGYFIMENNQKINCTVGSCKYNDRKNNGCNLEEIQVTPKRNCNTKKQDESMCGSYECE